MVYYVHCYMTKEAPEGVRNVKQIQRTAEATNICEHCKINLNETKAAEIYKNLTSSKKGMKRKKVHGFD
ncbi:jg2911 [Pararge aegeria aegeria]|uniref:Jg2911 protein n=1 Tax=Pararge aegeria aegeria TaxID=348720 RepID=A0A8S4SEN4_9NEOP|nr:jg2911 [Pararge aegeria aegeria]